MFLFFWGVGGWGWGRGGGDGGVGGAYIELVVYLLFGIDLDSRGYFRV